MWDWLAATVGIQHRAQRGDGVAVRAVVDVHATAVGSPRARLRAVGRPGKKTAVSLRALGERLESQRQATRYCATALLRYWRGVFQTFAAERARTRGVHRIPKQLLSMEE